MFNGKKFARELMCRPVRFDAYLSREHGEKKGERVWVEWTIEARDGWVIGATWVQTGIRHPGHGGGNGDIFGLYADDYEPPTFEETAPRRLVYLVTPWPTAKARYVPPEHVTLIPDDELHTFNPSAWDSASRELSAQWSKSYKRDERGRFVVQMDWE